jgi:HK97 family phage major capsid protein
MAKVKVNRDLISKAVFNLNTLTTGGRLNTEQANAFIQSLIDEPTLINDARTVKMTGDSRKIEKIGFGQRVLHPGVEGTDPGESNYSAPTTGTVELNAKEFIAVVKITDDTIENNIEGTSIEDTIMSLLAKRVALDMEEIVVKGDTASSDLFLKQLNGLKKQATAHIVDAASAALGKDIFKNAKKAMPKKYLRNASDSRFYVSYNTETEWTDVVGERVGQNGDDSFLNASVKPAYGIPVKGIAMLDAYDNGSGIDVSDALLVNPQNIIVGISRDIRIETERKPRERASYIVLTLKMDVKFEEEDAVVKITKIKD